MAGSIRSIGNSERAIINVDATPQILPNGNVRVQLGSRQPAQGTRGGARSRLPGGDTAGGPEEAGGSSLNQRATIVLEPTSRSSCRRPADPLSDRKITVEVRASILK